MVNCGSKGSNNNISQIMACIGQVTVDNKRIAFGFDRRTLPHFSKDDYGPESKGFCANGLVKGLTPTEFYFHAMGGRQGLVDTGCKTAQTGYMQRRLIKAAEDVQVKYDGTSRTSKDNVLQFIYGEDGMDAQLMENMKIGLVNMNNSAMAKHAKFFESEMEIDEKRQALKKSIRDDIVDDIDDMELV